MEAKQDSTVQSERAGERYETAREAYIEAREELSRLIDSPDKSVPVAEYRTQLRLAHIAAGAAHDAMLAAWLEPAEAAIAQVRPLLGDLIDSDDCSFDHHGGCQAHGYLSLQPGETCPQQDAKDWVKFHASLASRG